MFPASKLPNVWMEIAIIYDDDPSETWWNLQRKSSGSDSWDDSEVLKMKTHRGSDGNTFHTESICLQEGEFQFSIHADGWDGICCDNGDGYYNVTSYGELIAEGGEFGRVEWTEFTLPFVSPFL